MTKRNAVILGSVFVMGLMIFFPVTLLMNPTYTPLQYLQSKPYIEVGNVVWIVPSSTIIVYLLGMITILIGFKLNKFNDTYKKYWGVSLILWGIGTILAGTSYQGLGYELKCSGEGLCLFTSWFELSYLYITALSITVMGYAVSIKSLNRKHYSKYNRIISIGFIAYSFSLVLGVLLEIRLLVTYEWFLIFFLPYFISFMIINTNNNRVSKNKLDTGLMKVWILMLIVNTLYFAYYYSGIGETLYSKYNIWFSANDVLHVGLIPWMIYIYFIIKK